MSNFAKMFDGIIQSPAPNDNPNLSPNPFLDLTLMPSTDKLSTIGGLLILVLTNEHMQEHAHTQSAFLLATVENGDKSILSA